MPRSRSRDRKGRGRRDSSSSSSRFLYHFILYNFHVFVVHLHPRLHHQAHHRHPDLQDHQLIDAEEAIEVEIDDDLQSEGKLQY